jgi:hypothetical protein
MRSGSAHELCYLNFDFKFKFAVAGALGEGAGQLLWEVLIALFIPPLVHTITFNPKAARRRSGLNLLYRVRCAESLY